MFLLDASESMKTNDPDRHAIDSIAQVMYSLPSDYKVGFIAYSTEVCAMQELLDNSQRDQIVKATDDVQYQGYSNAGAGLAAAVNLFSEKGAEKYIVMLSDGEIDMPDNEQTEESRLLYVEAANQAKEKGVKIFITAIGTEMDSQMHIFDGAELTEGAVYWEKQNSSLSRLMEKIVTERLSVPMQSLGVTDAGGGSIHAKIPENTENIKVIVTSDTTLSEVSADYSATEGRVIAGQNFAVVDMQRPDSEYVDISFQTEDISGVKACMLVEYSAKLQMDITYQIEEIPETNGTDPLYEHFAEIVIKLLDVQDENTNLWQEDFEGREISLRLNDTLYQCTITQGQIQMSIPADAIEEVEAAVEMESEAAVYYIEQPVVGKIEKYPDPVPKEKPDYRPLWVILILLACSVFVIILWWIKKRNTTVIYMSAPLKETEKKIETKNCSYSGRFTMYVVRTKDGRDIPPQTYVLFGKTPVRMTLDKILNSCGIKCGKIGAEDIIFYPGPDHSVILMDQSERCTVMRGTEIVKKGMGYPIFYNEKITVAFEDDMTEMEIHYKNLSPGERSKVKKI